MKLKHFFLAFSIFYSFLALAVNQDTDHEELDESNEESIASAPNVNSQDMTNRLKEEMDYLRLTAEGQPRVHSVASNNISNKSQKMDDLEEKINFRSAAVKKADNHESEVNVDELDSENFE